MENWKVLRERCSGKDPAFAAERVLEVLPRLTFPVPVYDVLVGIGAQVRIEQGPGMEGGLHWSDPPTVFINSLNSDIRRRFTCAHEIGHLIMHPMSRDYIDRTAEGGPEPDPLERQANVFAAHLLMPLWQLEPVVLRHGKNVQASTDYFGVSPTALNWQLDLLR